MPIRTVANGVTFSATSSIGPTTTKAAIKTHAIISPGLFVRLNQKLPGIPYGQKL